MAHELTITNGLAEMAYVGNTPWHGLGQRLREGCTVEEMQDAAGLNWTIERAPVQFSVPLPVRYVDGMPHIGHEWKQKPDSHVLYRSDTLDHMSIVSARYKVVQPHDVLEFFRDLVGGAGFQLETAGSLNGGRRIWALARVTEDCTILEADKVGGYLLLATSCDGGLATTAFFTSVRVVCQNTLRMADQTARDRVSVPHSTVFDPKAVKGKLGIAQGAFDAFLANARRLASRKISADEADRIIVAAVGKSAAQMPVGWDVRKSRAYGEVMALFSGAAKGAELPEAANTAWGAVNAVTEYLDWHSRSRTADARMNSAWFGTGAGMKTAALIEAMKIAA